MRPKNTLSHIESHYPLPGLDMPFMIDHNRLFIERRDLSGEFIVYSDNPKFDSLNNNCNKQVSYLFFKTIYRYFYYLLSILTNLTFPITSR